MKSLHKSVISDPARLAAEIAGDAMATEAEIAEAIKQAIRHERSECQKIAAMYGGSDAEEIAEMIGQRSFK